MQNKQTLKAIKLWFLHLFFCTVWCFQSTKYAFYIHLQICTSSNRALRSSFTFLNFVCLARKSLSDQATAITVSWHIGWETSSKYISRQQTIKGGNTRQVWVKYKITLDWLRHMGDLHFLLHMVVCPWINRSMLKSASTLSLNLSFVKLHGNVYTD